MFDFDDDGFDFEDATTLAGAMGFAEESLREEEVWLGDEEEKPDSFEPPSEANLRLVYNQDPEFFMWLVKLIKKQNREWARKAQDKKAISDELKAIERSLKCEE